LLLTHQFASKGHRPVLERFDSGDSATELLDSCFEGQGIAEAEPEHLPVVVGQGGEHLLEVLPVPLVGEQHFGVAVLRTVTVFERDEPPVMAQHGGGLIAGEAEEPSSEG
jgi:hypothetical protein